jgi:PhnB protein
MASKVNPIRPGHTTVTPYLIVKGATSAIEFYKSAFGAKEVTCLADPSGIVMAAEISIGNAMIMLADESPEMGTRGPQSFGGSPVSIHLYMADADATVERAVKAGAKILEPVKDQFHGDRSGTIEDPFGYKWTIATHKEHVSFEEIKKRVAAMFGGGQ